MPATKLPSLLNFRLRTLFFGASGGAALGCLLKLMPFWKNFDLSYSHIAWLQLCLLTQTLKPLWSPVFDYPWSKRISGESLRLGWMALLAGGIAWSIFLIQYGSPTYLLSLGFVVAMASALRSSQLLLIISSQRDMVPKSLWGQSEVLNLVGFQIGIRLVETVAFHLKNLGIPWQNIYKYLGLGYGGVFVLPLVFMTITSLGKRSSGLSEPAPASSLSFIQTVTPLVKNTLFWPHVLLMLTYRVPAHLWVTFQKIFWTDLMGASWNTLKLTSFPWATGAILGSFLGGKALKNPSKAQAMTQGSLALFILMTLTCLLGLRGTPSFKGLAFFLTLGSLMEGLFYFSIIPFAFHQLAIAKLAPGALVSRLALLTSLDYALESVLGFLLFRSWELSQTFSLKALALLGGGCLYGVFRLARRPGML